MRWLLMGSVCVVVPSCGGKTSVGDEANDDSASDAGASERLRAPTSGSAGAGGAAADSRKVDAPEAGEASEPGAEGGASGASHGGTSAAAPIDGAGASHAVTPSASLALTCEPWIRGGWERCNGGVLHRVAIGECPSRLPRSFPLALRDPEGGPPMIECERDADCTARAHGECVLSEGFGDTHCRYGCTRDDECDPGFACVCGHTIGRCQAASCGSDADCGAGLACLGWDSPACGGGYALSCQTPEDECIGDGDCAAGHTCGLEHHGPRRRCKPAEDCD